MKFQFKGLTQEEVEASRKEHGSNELTPYEIESFWSKLVENFKDPIIIILTGALVVIFILSLFGLTEWYEAVAIGLAVLLATFVATLSEYSNETSFQKLQEEASQISTNVFREGHVTHVPINELVVGDYVLLQSGDKVPADGALASGELKINQASLTGESEAVTKRVPHDDEELKDMDLSNPYHLFRGSVVEDGEAVMRVETVGDKSFYGVLAKELAESETRLSPLQLKLKGLADQISKLGYSAAVLIAITFLFNKFVIAQDFDWDKIVAHLGEWDLVITEVMNALVLSIIIVVAAIPEGLPMMIAIVLALNMRKLLKEKVLVRKLLGIETAGSLNILFSDKTGTITKGKLEPKMFIDGSGKKYDSYPGIGEQLGTLIGF
ncbi:MAG: HAD-IC family P-type ATPase, partial [Bacteroidota bacterium]